MERPGMWWKVRKRCWNDVGVSGMDLEKFYVTPAQVESLGGKRYYNLFQDKHSHKEKVYFIRHKSESLDYYKHYEAWAKVQWGAVIKVFGCDQGGEYTGKEFTDHLEHQGTICHLTVHDSPASNGGPECANWTHLDIAQAMIIQSCQPNFLWAEAIRHSVEMLDLR